MSPMKIHFSWNWALVLVSILYAPTLQSKADWQMQKKSMAEKPTLSGKSGNYETTIFVKTGIEDAWEKLTAYESMVGIMPDIKDAKVVKRRGNRVLLRQVYQAPYTFGLPIRVLLEVNENRPSKMSYSLINGDMMRSLGGVWSITPEKGGVRLIHQVKIEPILPDAIRPLYDKLSTKNLTQSMSILKSVMEKD